MRYTILLAMWGLALGAQQRPPLPPYVQATGEATVTAKPDQAKISIGVVTQAATAAAAAAQNATQVSGVIEQLRKAAGAAGEIKTTSYSVSPNYTYPRNAPATITGYTASNAVEVTVSDLAQLGKIIDAATQSGANNVQRLQFGLKNDQAVRARALREAAAQAKANAEAMASGIGLKITRVLALEEGAAPSPPVRFASLSASAASQTPVQAGDIEVHTSVTLRVEIGQ